MRTLLWFRGKDLRLDDHAALSAGCADSRELLPVFVLAPKHFETAEPSAPHRLQFLLDSLQALQAELRARGSDLLIVRGPASRALPRLCSQLKIERVLAMRSCEPACRTRDAKLSAQLAAAFETFEHETLTVPGSVRTASGGPFRVYTPFARAARTQLAQVRVQSAPRQLPPLPELPAGPRSAALPSLESLGLRRNPALQAGGEAAARSRLEAFLAGPAQQYEVDRDRMDRAGTSRLSADLRFGTLSVRRVWQTATHALAFKAPRALERFQAELLWREFAHHLLSERPGLLAEPFRADFHDFPWLADELGFEAWRRGRTGYPIVDAAARQLLETGFVHNRARMIAASFLTKHLLVDYRRGEAHYLQYLTDGDPAQNNLGWQWSAGSGCDAQPYFRVFNPVTQGERFDPDGGYVRRYVPELARLPSRYIHAPWLAPGPVLRDARVELGFAYPQPIVDHATARQRYLLIASEHIKAARDA